MQSDHRLSAVSNIELQASPGIDSDLVWFYADVAGLTPVDAPSDAETHVLRFKSDRLEIRITIVENPAIESVDDRVTLIAPDLEQVAHALAKRKHPYHWFRGLRFTDQALILLDPAGNRIRIRRRWPSARL